MSRSLSSLERITHDSDNVRQEGGAGDRSAIVGFLVSISTSSCVLGMLVVDLSSIAVM
jgi:hypothetical protein